MTAAEAAAGGWGNTGLSKDREALIVPRRSGTLDRETLKRAFYSKCLGTDSEGNPCDYENATTGAVGGGTQHAETHAHPLLVVYYAEYKYAPTAKGRNAALLRQQAAEEKLKNPPRIGRPRNNPIERPNLAQIPIDLNEAIQRAAAAIGLVPAAQQQALDSSGQPRRPRGRPLGSKDTKPRKPRESS